MGIMFDFFKKIGVWGVKDSQITKVEEDKIHLTVKGGRGWYSAEIELAITKPGVLFVYEMSSTVPLWIKNKVNDYLYSRMSDLQEVWRVIERRAETRKALEKKEHALFKLNAGVTPGNDMIVRRRALRKSIQQDRFDIKLASTVLDKKIEIFNGK